MFRACQVLGKVQILRRLHREILHSQVAFPHLECGFHRVRQAGALLVGSLLVFGMIDHQPIHHGFNCVDFVAIQRYFILQAHHLPIHPHADKPGFADFLKDSLVSPLAPTDNGSKDQQPCTIREVKQQVHNFLCRLFDHLTPADRAVGNAHPGKQEAQVIINLGYRANRGAWVVRSTFLVNGNCRRQTINVIHIRFFHLSQELAGIRREGFNISTLPFGKDGIKCQRAFARTRETGNDNQLVPWDFHGDVFQIMGTRPDYTNDILRHNTSIQLIQRNLELYHPDWGMADPVNIRWTSSGE